MLRYSVGSNAKNSQFTSEGHLLACGYGSVEIRRERDGSLVREVWYTKYGASQRINVVLLKGGRAFAVLFNNRVFVHCTDNGEELYQIEDKTSGIASNLGGTILARAGGGSVSLLEPSIGSTLAEAEIPDTGHTLDFDPKGRYLGVSSVDGAMIYELPSLRQVATLPKTNSHIKFSDCGRFVGAVVISPEFPRVRIFSTEGWLLLGEVGPALDAYVFTCGGDFVVATRKHYRKNHADLSVWSTSSGQRCWLNSEAAPYTAVSPNGQLVANGSVSVYSVESGQVILQLEPVPLEPNKRPHYPVGLRFHPDRWEEETLAFTARGTLTVWDFLDGFPATWDEGCDEMRLALEALRSGNGDPFMLLERLIQGAVAAANTRESGSEPATDDTRRADKRYLKAKSQEVVAGTEQAQKAVNEARKAICQALKKKDQALKDLIAESVKPTQLDVFKGGLKHLPRGYEVLFRQRVDQTLKALFEKIGF